MNSCVLGTVNGSSSGLGLHGIQDMNTFYAKGEMEMGAVTRFNRPSSTVCLMSLVSTCNSVQVVIELQTTPFSFISGRGSRGIIVLGWAACAGFHHNLYTSHSVPSQIASYIQLKPLGCSPYLLDMITTLIEGSESRYF